MKMYHRLIVVALVSGLTACAAQYTDSEFPKQVTLDNASARVDVRFAPGSSRLLAGGVARLRALAGAGSLAPSDRVTVSAAGTPALAAARFASVARVLLPYRIVAMQGPLTPVRPNRAIIESERYLVTLPPCPNWSKYPVLGMSNTHASNFGCTTAVDLALMVASPADLAEGRPVGLVDAVPAAAAFQRYQADKVTLPSGGTFSVGGGGGGGATGSGATGAGTAGSQP